MWQASQVQPLQGLGCGGWSYLGVFLSTLRIKTRTLFGGIGLSLGVGALIFNYLGFIKLFLGEDISNRPLLTVGMVLICRSAVAHRGCAR